MNDENPVCINRPGFCIFGCIKLVTNSAHVVTKNLRRNNKPVDEEGEQYETYFLNLVDEADLLAAVKAAGVELPACTCGEKCAVGAIDTACPVCSISMADCAGVEPEPAETEEPAEEPETGGSMGTLLLILAVAGIGGGAAFYFKVIRPKQQQAAEPEEDYGEDYEDDGPPLDEDEENSEEEER